MKWPKPTAGFPLDKQNKQFSFFDLDGTENH
jgi:hypothetical protein